LISELVVNEFYIKCCSLTNYANLGFERSYALRSEFVIRYLKK